MTPVKSHSAPALDRGLSLLELLAESRMGLTPAEAARKLVMPRSSMHSLVHTLERRGYVVRRSGTHRYRLGLKLFSMANLALSERHLLHEATPLMYKLMQQSGLTVHLAVMERGEAIIMQKVSPPGQFRATWVGKRLDLHCSGVGKALLAALSDEEFQAIVKNYGFTRYNENTITSVRRLREEMARTRVAGYAFEDEEGELGFRCIGAPILDESGRPAAAVSIAGTTDDITPNTLSAMAKMVQIAARQISSALASRQENPGTPPSFTSH
jgi:DNA-binding IclR family transcriptional regulator